MKSSTSSIWVQTNIPEYQFLSPCDQLSIFSDGNADSCDQVERAASLGLTAEHIYFSAPGKTEDALRRSIGKCRFIANDRAELDRINRVAQPLLKPGFLESVGLRIIPEAYDDKKQFGIPERELPELAQAIKAFGGISVRGCFVQGSTEGLHGKALGRYFRTCYELAKRMTVILPCGMPYLCIDGGAESAHRNALEHPETLEDFLREAKIVATQNQNAFYARLLIT